MLPSSHLHNLRRSDSLFQENDGWWDTGSISGLGASDAAMKDGWERSMSFWDKFLDLAQRQAGVHSV